MLRSDEYINILQTRVITQLQDLFPEGNGVFQQDLAPCHTAKKVKAFFQQDRLRATLHDPPWGFRRICSRTILSSDM